MQCSTETNTMHRGLEGRGDESSACSSRADVFVETLNTARARLATRDATRSVKVRRHEDGVTALDTGDCSRSHPDLRALLYGARPYLCPCLGC